MATDKQIAANRENAKKSTGPGTPQGKVISSMNALKTGIDIASELMRLESKADFDQLTTEYYEDFAPANAIERALVDQLIRNEWLSRRYAAVESAVWDRRFEQSKSEDLGAAFFYGGDTFLQLDRVRNSVQRNYARALKELTALRKARAAAIPVREPAQPTAQPESPESLTHQLASFLTFPESPEIQREMDPAPGENDPPIAA